MIKIYTDGSCLVNPGGAGGWAFVVADQSDVCITDTTEFFCGGEPSTTNNAMELRAILEALRWAEKNRRNNFFIHTDSKYAMKVCNEWSKLWAKNKWKNREGQTVANLELVKEIYQLGQSIKYSALWVPGHTGNLWNEFADSLANKIAFKMQKGHGAIYADIELGEQVVVTKDNGHSIVFSVTAKFITSGTIILSPVYLKTVKPLVISAKDFDSRKFIKI